MSGGGDRAGDAVSAADAAGGRGARVPDPVKAREYIQYLIDRAMEVDEGDVHPSEAMFLLEFDSGIGMVTWVRTAEELLTPNGSEPLIAWMLRESEVRKHTVFRLERLPADGGRAPDAMKTAGTYRRMAAALTQDFLPMAGEHEYDTSEKSLAALEARIGWITALADAAHFAQDELTRLQLGLTRRAAREADRAKEKRGKNA